MRFVAIVKEACVTAFDGTVYELCRGNVLKDRNKSTQFAEVKRRQEEHCMENSVRAVGYLASMAAQRPPSEKRLKMEHRLGFVMAQAGALSNKTFQSDGKSLEEAVRDNDDNDSSDEEEDLLGDPEADSSRGGSANA